MAATGLTGVHFQCLRHAGSHLVAEAGASLRELLERMGHASSRASLIYLHSTDDRQRTLAEAVSHSPSGTSPENPVARLWQETAKQTTWRTRPREVATRLTCAYEGRPEQDSNLRPTA
jgi:hypothetical protein